MVGQPLLAAPPPSLNTWKVGQVGVPFRHHFEGRRRLIEGEHGGEQKKKNNSSSPASLRVQGKKMMVLFKTAPFWVLSYFFFFFFNKKTVHETASFLPKRAVSFKWIWRQKRVRFKVGLQFVRVLRFSPWSRISSI